MSGSVSNNQVLQEVRALREDVAAVLKLLIGCAEEPDKPGLVERVRLVEATVRLVRGMAWIVGSIILGDVVVRLISLYRGGP